MIRRLLGIQNLVLACALVTMIGCSGVSDQVNGLSDGSAPAQVTINDSCFTRVIPLVFDFGPADYERYDGRVMQFSFESGGCVTSSANSGSQYLMQNAVLSEVIVTNTNPARGPVANAVASPLILKDEKAFVEISGQQVEFASMIADTRMPSLKYVWLSKDQKLNDKNQFYLELN